MSKVDTLHAVDSNPRSVPMQAASLDIWQQKYQLKDRLGQAVDRDIDHGYERVARALADIETTQELREQWYRRFLWALQHGAIPAGRIMSNAGAQGHKPATSTIIVPVPHRHRRCHSPPAEKSQNADVQAS